MTSLKLLPLWKNAVQKFLESKFETGRVIDRSWFVEEFELSPPKTAQEQIQFQLDFMICMEALKDDLLVNHQIELVNVRGEGYKIVPPKDQTQLALMSGVVGITKEINKMQRSMEHVDRNQLSNDERKENSDGLAKVSAIKSMFHQERLLDWRRKDI